MSKFSASTGLEIAIVGMAGRFPGASNLDKFWENLANGVESIQHFSMEELTAAGISAAMLENPDYIRAKGIIDAAMAFDAQFFGYSSREAKYMDPQMRIYHECCWAALEDAGYAPGTTDSLTGIYGGIGSNPYWTAQFLHGSQEKLGAAGLYEIGTVNSDEFYNTRIAYALNLKGPAITVQTACSSSLVAVHLAIQGLLGGECDLALAGGVRVSANAALTTPDKYGYLYQEGMILSSDGHCRSFDQAANGTVGGDGVGMVVLKRLEDAITDKDYIYAVIKGAAINNDGRDKVGYTAPSVSGQCTVITNALHMAEIAAESISYVEAHGTGTSLGDPIEIEALTQAYQTTKTNFCKIGSVKSNLGHLDTAAGIAGLIKTVLAIQARQLPPSLHYTKANPKIDFAKTPFTVNTTLTPWESETYSLRAGVSSFGIGGTNAHLILEEHPKQLSEASQRDLQLISLSAKTEPALAAAQQELSAFLKKPQDVSLADLAYSLHRGRYHFPLRVSYLAKSLPELSDLMDKNSAKSPLSKTAHDASQDITNRPVYFLFSGQGSQYIDMGKGLYQQEPHFRLLLDECLALAKQHTETDFHALLFPEADAHTAASEKLQDTYVAQFLLFIIEYSLARFLIQLGIKPSALLGHSIGEYVAACLSGVMSLQQALRIVLKRGQLMRETERGAMLSIPLSAEEIQPLLSDGVSIAAYNSPKSVVVSGDTSAIQVFAETLKANDILYVKLKTAHGFHSQLMEPVLDEFSALLKSQNFSAPQIPYLSNYSGDWMGGQVQTDPDYWALHLRHPVRFAQNISQLLSHKQAIFIELGPGNSLAGLINQNPNKTPEQLVLTTLPRHDDNNPDTSRRFLETLAKLHNAGLKIDWETYYANEQRRRIPLPTYPFQREVFLPDQLLTFAENTPTAAPQITEQPNCFIPVWEQEPTPQTNATVLRDAACLVFLNNNEFADLFIQELAKLNDQATIVFAGTDYQYLADKRYQINPANAEDYRLLSEELVRSGRLSNTIIHMFAVGTPSGDHDSNLASAFYSPIFLVQALNAAGINEDLHLSLVSNNARLVTGEELLQPEKATLNGPARVIGQEYEHIVCKQIDIQLATTPEKNLLLSRRLLQELNQRDTEKCVALRGKFRWLRKFNKLETAASVANAIVENGTYLLTGGLGGIGLNLAQALAKYRTTSIVWSRKEFPPAETWEACSNDHSLSPLLRQQIQSCLQLKHSGGHIEVMQVDVTDSKAVHSTMHDILARHKKLNGIFHLAGVPSGKALQHKTPQEMQAVLDPKIKGTNNLLAAIEHSSLDFFALFSSVTSVLGGFGQADYCAANAFLDALAASKTGLSETRFVAINWDVWKETGMALEAAQQRLQANRLHPLLGSLSEKNSEHLVFSNTLRVVDQWALEEHRIAGKATLPGTAYLEMARAAVLSQAENNPSVYFEDVYFLAPMVVKDDVPLHIKTTLSRQATNYEFVIASRTSIYENWSLHATGTVGQTSSAPSTKICTIEALKTTNIIKTHENISDYQALLKLSDPQAPDLPEHVAKYGPRWNGVRAVFIGKTQALAQLILQPTHIDDLKQFPLHPALLDCATSSLRPFFAPGNYLPIFYKKLTIYRPLEAEIYSLVKIPDKFAAETGTLTIDVLILNNKGEILLEIEGFSMREANSERLQKNDLTQLEKPVTDKMPLESNPADNFLLNGLETKPALETLFKLLGTQHASVVVTKTADFNHTLATFDQPETIANLSATAPTQRLPRPELSNAYQAPKTETEKQLAKIWEELLGLDSIGILDDFFDLGGHSLLLMQFHRKVKQIFDTNMSITDLYKHTTISTVAAYLTGSAETETDQLDDIEERVKKGQGRRKRKKPSPSM